MIKMLTRLLKTERNPRVKKIMEIDLISYKAIKHLIDRYKN